MNARALPILFSFLAVMSVAALPVGAHAAQGDCGQPVSTNQVTASDALWVLQSSVGSQECTLCVCDVNDSGDITATDALIVLNAAVGLEVTLNCPTECEVVDEDAECPSTAQFALFAEVRGPCSSNADCTAFSVCDTEIGRCRTATEADIGWTGLAHNADVNDPVPARLFVDCEGPAPCGQCEITGHDPSLGNCRCENDNLQRCFTVAGPDEANCGGEQCICYFGPPLPLMSGTIPTCVLNTIGSQPGGTANVDEGSGDIQIHLREIVHLGISLYTPCPICTNDPTPADGMRGGTCVGGANDGGNCDAQAVNYTFPPPTGAFHSLDCMPTEGTNITGSGLDIHMVLTTGTSQLTAELPCTGDEEDGEQLCHCLVCSGRSSLGCSSNADCEAEGAGTCSSFGPGTQPAPNGCSDLECMDAGGGEGFCSDTFDQYCDGLVRSNGGGLIGCNTNVDCEPSSIGQDAGDCGLVEQRPCFQDTIVAQGAPHPLVPRGAATFCVPPTAASGVNLAAGLPGPGRLVLQTALTLFCSGTNYTATYTPGTGGCPAPTD